MARNPFGLIRASFDRAKTHASEGADSRAKFGDRYVTTRVHLLQPKPPLLAVFAFSLPRPSISHRAATVLDSDRLIEPFIRCQTEGYSPYVRLS